MIADITVLDLLRLAQQEFRRFDELADCGSIQMFSSARLAQQLIAEATDMLENDGPQGMAWWNSLAPSARVYWMDRAGNTGIAADAWEAFKRSRDEAEV